MILNIENAIAERETQKSEQLEGEFRKLVVELSTANTAPDPDNLIAKLQRLGKTSADLQAALDRRRERCRLVELVKAVPQHREAYAKHHAALTEEVERFAPLRAAHETRVRELQSLRSQAQMGERDGSTAEQQLRATCGPKLLDSIQVNAELLVDIDERIRQAGYEIERLESEVSRVSQERPPMFESDERVEMAAQERRQKVGELEAKIGKCQSSIETWKSQRQSKADELARLRADALLIESF